jgi:hypothetical protein
MRTDILQSAIDTARHARGDRDAQLIYLLDQMVSRIVQLEARLDHLSDLTVGDGDAPFDARVIAVLEDRDRDCRAALSLGWDDVERQILSTIEDNSYTVFTHIEAEIEEKLESVIEGHRFAEAVEEAVKGSIAQTVEEIIEDRISSDFLDADAEDVVRKGLRSIL